MAITSAAFKMPLIESWPKWRDGHIVEKTIFMLFWGEAGKFAATSNNDAGEIVKVSPFPEIYGICPRLVGVVLLKTTQGIIGISV